MKNLAKRYLAKASEHLFTRDGHTFMKVLPVHDCALQIEFGAKQSASILHDLERFEEESSAGKRYVSQRLKWYFFPVWKECYYAVKGGKRFRALYEKITTIMDPDLNYGNYVVRKQLVEHIEACIVAHFEE